MKPMKAIVAVGENWAIGRDNRLLFSIPEDMKFFYNFTKNKTVVMGRNTFESLPNSEPLKNRRNIVLSGNKDLRINGAEVYNSLEALLEAVKDDEDVIVIGGEAVYKLMLDYCSEVYVTKVKASVEADRYFPDLDALKEWELKSTSEEREFEGTRYEFCKWGRIYN